MNKVKELGVSFVRTSLVPPAVGFVLAFLTDHGITQIKSTWVFTVVTVVFSGLYYVLFRGIEIATQNPTVQKWAGILLGYARDQVVPPVFSADKKRDEGQANVWTVVCLVVVVILVVVVLRNI